MAKDDRMLMFLAGFGIGAAAAVLLAPQAGGELRARLSENAGRAGDYLKDRADSLNNSVGDVLAQGKRTWSEVQEKGRDAMSDWKDKAKDKIDDAADASKKATDKVADKSKDLAHDAGKKMEQGGKRLQDA